MYPLVPPPVSDVGAYQVPRTLQRWLDPNPITALTRTQSYIVLPTFSVSTVWFGYSDIIASFNYEGPNNFSLQINREILPVTTTYLLCISWTDTNYVMHRYKVWQNVGEVIYFPCPLYTGQKIGKNFRFEIWSVSQSIPVNTGQTYVIGTETGGILGLETGGEVGQE